MNETPLPTLAAAMILVVVGGAMYGMFRIGKLLYWRTKKDTKQENKETLSILKFLQFFFTTTPYFKSWVFDSDRRRIRTEIEKLEEGEKSEGF